MDSYTAVEDADEPVRIGCAKSSQWCVAAQTHGFGRMRLRRSGLARRAEGLWASEESGKALVSGEPDEPIDAACARQPLELVLASVL